MFPFPLMNILDKLFNNISVFFLFLLLFSSFYLSILLFYLPLHLLFNLKPSLLFFPLKSLILMRFLTFFRISFFPFFSFLQSNFFFLLSYLPSLLYPLLLPFFLYIFPLNQICPLWIILSHQTRQFHFGALQSYQYGHMV